MLGCHAALGSACIARKARRFHLRAILPLVVCSYQASEHAHQASEHAHQAMARSENGQWKQCGRKCKQRE